MNTYVLHKNGRIHGLAGVRPDEIELMMRNHHCDYVEGHGTPFEHYVKDGSIVPLEAATTTLEGHVLAGVPVAAKIYIDGVEYIAEDATVELSFNLPGTYQVRVDGWPQKEVSFEVNVP